MMKYEVEIYDWRLFMDTSDLAKRMKDYEKRNRYYLQRRLPVIIRCDMRAGHTYTRGFKRPFDDVLIKTMQETAKYLCENIQGCVLGYTQSDEISLVLVDYQRFETSAWFDYEVQKMCSVAASMATMAFNNLLHKNVADTIWRGEYSTIYDDALRKGAMFDARVFNIPKEEVANCIYWRQLDASRNSIQMVGQANFSHKELQNKSCNDIQDMLMTQKDINWNDLPTYQKRGSCVVRNKYIFRHYYSTITGENREYDLRDPAQDERAWIIDKDIPIFKGEGRDYIEELVMVGEQ